jgi:hypothetical protein
MFWKLSLLSVKTIIIISIAFLLFMISLRLYFSFFGGTGIWAQDLHLEPLHQPLFFVMGSF